MQPFASVAVTVKLKGPVTSGVPVRAPVGRSETPAGSAPAVTAYVTAPTPPAWLRVAEYATPAVPVAGTRGPSVIVGQAIVRL